MISLMLFITAPVAGAAIAATLLVLPTGLDLTEKEQKSLQAVVDSINKELEKHTKGYISETKFKELADGHLVTYFKDNNPNAEAIKKLEDALEAQGLAIKGLKESGGKPQEFKSFAKQIDEQLKGKSLLDAMQEAPGGKLKFILKAANSPITTANIVPGGSAYVPMPTMDSGYDRAPQNARFIRQYASVSTTTSPSHAWAEKFNEDGQAAFIGEGDLKPAYSFQIRTNKTDARKVGITAKFTKETLKDIPGFMAELNSDVINEIEIKEEADILNGDGVGDNLLGVIPQSTTYVLTAVKTERANNFDAIKAGYTQQTTLNQNPNIVYLNPIDSANMEMTKAGDGHYVLPPFTTADGNIISGVRVKTANQIDIGKFLIGDFSKLNIRDYVELEIVLGWENDDMSRGYVTVVGEKRLMTYIKEFQKTAFLYGDFATIKAAIEIA